MSTNFPGSPYMMGFVGLSREMGDEFSYLFSYYGKLMREAMLFPNDEVYHRMEI